ncbi:MAG TPA: M20/M25/M40 family metallo-hydrolase [Thermoanaerobaculia bacterium]|nr:M20/M25/M40 family metallo-hydrolase [Thermoanaerobaculia bacterium]
MNLDRSSRPAISLVLFAALAMPLGAQESVTDMYRDTAGRILGAALTDDEGWDKLTHLTTAIGHRLSGSPQLEEAIAWAVETMRREGLENVAALPVRVPHWVRGRESLEVLAPSPRQLALLGLGGTVATPEDGITAPVVVVESFEELDRLGRERVEGRVVVFAVPWEGYGRTVRYRTSGASRAAAHGALAALVRSATGSSLYTPHTGALRYDESLPRIPAAAITVEDAEWFRRVAAAGTPATVRLVLDARTLPDADSANVIAEIRGSELPNEVVVMGGHFDSWDVGQGAHDDGAACVAAWQALRLIAKLGLRPRRTLRVVLWTNEENGLAGARAYRDWVGDAVGNHVAAIEMDGGAERPIGFGLGIRGLDPEAGDPRYEVAFSRLREVGALLDAIDAGEIARGGGGADIGPLMAAGVPGLALRTVEERYFDWHHTHADTLDKVDPQNLRRAIAALGVVGFVLADMPGRLWEPELMDPAAGSR